MQDLVKKPLKEVDSIFKACKYDSEKTVETVLEFFKKQLDCSTKDLLKVGSYFYHVYFTSVLSVIRKHKE